VRNEFKKNKDVKEIEKIEVLKGSAIRALSSYLMMESSAKDERFQRNVAKFTKSEADSLNHGKD
jgi:hypothetical protein